MMGRPHPQIHQQPHRRTYPHCHLAGAQEGVDDGQTANPKPTRSYTNTTWRKRRKSTMRLRKLRKVE